MEKRHYTSDKTQTSPQQTNKQKRHIRMSTVINRIKITSVKYPSRFCFWIDIHLKNILDIIAKDFCPKSKENS